MSEKLKKIVEKVKKKCRKLEKNRKFEKKCKKLETKREN